MYLQPAALHTSETLGDSAGLRVLWKIIVEPKTCKHKYLPLCGEPWVTELTTEASKVNAAEDDESRWRTVWLELITIEQNSPAERARAAVHGTMHVVMLRGHRVQPLS